jgi:c-di-AMP phosphodiesterase-like protein
MKNLFFEINGKKRLFLRKAFYLPWMFFILFSVIVLFIYSEDKETWIPFIYIGLILISILFILSSVKKDARENTFFGIPNEPKAYISKKTLAIMFFLFPLLPIIYFVLISSLV